MRIVDQQRRLRERGRIRLGYSTLNEQGKKIPHKLKTFRFSAPDEAVLRAVAELYGGDVEPWEGGGRDRFHVISDATELPVTYAPHLGGCNQCYEQYRNGFCVVRCDGVNAQVPGKRGMIDTDCMCDADARDCHLTTNLNLVLRQLPGMGMWRLVTRGRIAGVELVTACEVIESITALGAWVDCVLGVEVRELRRLRDGKPQVRRFPVPTLDIVQTVAELGTGDAGAAGRPLPPATAAPARVDTPALEDSGWKPVDQAALPPAPFVSVRDQLDDVERPVKRRANAAPLIPETGLEPRTVDEVEQSYATTCSVCGEPYGAEAVVANPEPLGSRFVHKRCRATLEAPDDRGGAASGDSELVAEPAPVVALAARINAKQNSELFALATKIWPPTPGMSGRETDDERRRQIARLCELCGQPGVESRKEITETTADRLLDYLRRVDRGELVLTVDALWDARTGEQIAELPQ